VGQDFQIDGNTLKQFQPSRCGNTSVAQVMTRGTVKSKLITERKWAIRSQPPISITRDCREGWAVQRLKVNRL
jgi:hypothetical protein